MTIQGVAHDGEIDLAQLRNTRARFVLIKAFHKVLFVCVEESVRLDVLNIVIVANASDSDTLPVVVNHFLLGGEMNHCLAPLFESIQLVFNYLSEVSHDARSVALDNDATPLIDDAGVKNRH